MSGNSLKSSAILYKDLGDRYRSLFARYNQFNSDLKEWGCSVDKLSAVVQKFPSSKYLVQVEEDINKIITEASCQKPLDIFDLSKKIESLCPKIVAMSEELEKLEKENKKLLSLPDYYGRKQLTDGITKFLSDVSRCGIKDIDAAEKSIRKIKDLIRELYGKLSDDDKSLADLKKQAQGVLTQINDKFSKYRDEHGIRNICKSGRDLCDCILNRVKANETKKYQVELADFCLNLKNVKNDFEADTALVCQFRTTLRNNSYLMWEEQYDEFLDKFDDYSPEYVETVSDVSDIFSSYCEMKKLNMEELDGEFSEKVRLQFSSRIQKIKEGLFPVSEFRSLVWDMEYYVEQQKKKTIYLVLKIVGGVIAIGTFIYFLINFTGWTIAVTIIAAIIFYKIAN